jgi:hypothetical protein
MIKSTVDSHQDHRKVRSTLDHDQTGLVDHERAKSPMAPLWAPAGVAADDEIRREQAMGPVKWHLPTSRE